MTSKKFKKKNKGILNDERGSISYFVVFVILVITLTFLFGVGIPFLQTFTLDIYGVTDDLIDDARESALQINDANAQAAVLASLNAQETALQDQQEIYGVFIQYSIVLVIVIVAFVLFMASRRDVEQGIG